MSKRAILANIVRATSVSLNTCPTDEQPCNCDQAKTLQSELAELRAAAHLVLARVDRSNSVGREAAQRLERALAVGGEEKEPDSELAADMELVRESLPKQNRMGAPSARAALDRIASRLRT